MSGFTLREKCFSVIAFERELFARSLQTTCRRGAKGALRCTEISDRNCGLGVYVNLPLPKFLQGSVHSRRHSFMNFALHTAAREGKLAELTSLLAQGSAISVRDKHSRTPLHLSAWAGHLECCKVLVAHGADKSAAAMDDTTALHFAAQKGHPEVVRFLLNEGTSTVCRSCI